MSGDSGFDNSQSHENQTPLSNVDHNHSSDDAINPDLENDRKSSSISSIYNSSSNEKEANIEEGRPILKADSIVQECVDFIYNISRVLSQLKKFKEELEKEFSQDEELKIKITEVFRDIVPLNSVYKMIEKSLGDIQYQNGFLLPDLFLHQEIKSSLNFYKSFLSQYAVNSKWIVQLSKTNVKCQRACQRSIQGSAPDECLSLESCHYSVFNSLFSLELIIERYSKCFQEQDPECIKAREVKTILRNILLSVPQDQEIFIKTHHELNLLTGRSVVTKVSTRFISKVTVKKYSSKDNTELTRLLVLFSDCLYVSIPSHNTHGMSKVRQELSLRYMKVSKIPDEASVKGKEGCGLNINTLEMNKAFYFEDINKMKCWKELIQAAIGSVNTFFSNSKPPAILGVSEPIWQKDNATGYCNGLNCLSQFTLANRRHHCRADGLIYCDSCSSYRIKLKFNRSKYSRVCDLCYKILSENTEQVAQYKKDLNSVFQRKTRKGAKLSWLKVANMKSPKNYLEYFCELDAEDPFLKLYRNSEDKVRSFDIILLGMKIATGENSKYFPNMKPNKFTIEYFDRLEGYLFKALDSENCNEWVKCLQDSLNKYCNKERP